MQTVAYRRFLTSPMALSLPVRLRVATRLTSASTRYSSATVWNLSAFSSNPEYASFSDPKSHIWLHRCVLLIAASTAALLLPQDSTQCCGIAGVIGTPDYDARYEM